MNMHFYFDKPAKLFFGSEKTKEPNSPGNFPYSRKTDESVDLEEAL